MPFQDRRKRGTTALLALYAALLATLMAAIALYQFPQSPNSGTDPVDQESRYVGTILIPREVGGDCRQLKFDNNTGAVQDVAVVPCGDGGSSSPPANSNSTVGRMNAIRDAFKK